MPDTCRVDVLLCVSDVGIVSFGGKEGAQVSWAMVILRLDKEAVQARACVCLRGVTLSVSLSPVIIWRTRLLSPILSLSLSLFFFFSSLWHSSACVNVRVYASLFRHPSAVLDRVCLSPA